MWNVREGNDEGEIILDIMVSFDLAIGNTLFERY